MHHARVHAIVCVDAVAAAYCSMVAESNHAEMAGAPRALIPEVQFHLQRHCPDHYRSVAVMRCAAGKFIGRASRSNPARTSGLLAVAALALAGPQLGLQQGFILFRFGPERGEIEPQRMPGYGKAHLAIRRVRCKKVAPHKR